MGAAKAVLVSDPELQGSDALTTAKVLAKAIERLGGADLVITATESTDGYTGTVPEQVAELLGLPSVTFAKHVEAADGVLRVRRQTEEGFGRGHLPAPGRGVGDRRCRRAPIPELQGDHGRQVQAGRTRSPPPTWGSPQPGGPARARRSWTSQPPKPGRPARSWRTTARGYAKIVAFLENLKVI